MAGFITSQRSGNIPIQSILGSINNLPTFHLYKESLKDPIGFFMSFEDEMMQLILDLSRKNPEPMTLFSYSLMMRNIETSRDVVQMDILISAKHPIIKILPEHVHSNISDVVLDYLRIVFQKLYQKRRTQRRHRLLFVSFQYNRQDATRWPVLPLEWIEKNRVLHYAIRNINEQGTIADKERYMANLTMRGWAQIMDYFEAQLSMRCEFSKKRVCMRHPDTAIPRRGIDIYPISELVRLARECGIPDADTDTPRGVICNTLGKYQPMNVALDLFKRFFRKELMESFEKQPCYHITMKGGYNLKILLENQFDQYNQIFTTDLDFSVSSHNSRWDMDRIIRFWETRLDEFINLGLETQRLFSIHKVIIDNPDTRNGLYQIIQLKYRQTDFVDLSFITKPLPVYKLNRRLSKKIGLPIRKWNVALTDLFDLILRENDPDADSNSNTFEKRNPIIGLNREKGIRDLYRARTACNAIRTHPRVEFAEKEKMKKLCSLAKDLTLPRILAMGEKGRSAFFKNMANILGYSISRTNTK